MRVDVTPAQLDVVPGVVQSIFVTVTNTETIIGGYTLRVLGADPSWITLPAENISLFPDETRTLEIKIDAPRGLPAGNRRLAVQVRELTEPYASTISEIDLAVPEAPQSVLRVDPMVVTAGKRATYSLLVENTGNTALDGYLSGDDPENQVRFAFEPEHIALLPGQHSVIEMRAQAKRAFFGTPTVRTLSVYLDPHPPGEPLAGAEEEPSEEERDALAGATFIQKSVMARGALSLVGLLVAITVFAVVITLALSRLVAQSTADRNLALQVAAAKDAAANSSGSSGIAGTVRQLTSGAGVPGVSVSVYTESDTTTAVATTATSSDRGRVGAYTITNLPAGTYKVSFRGAGFVQLWYPGAASAENATSVTLEENQVRGNVNVSLGGVPSTIRGSVSGDDVGAATLFLETVPSTAGGAAPNAARSSPLRAPTTPNAPITAPDNGGAVVQQVPIGSDGTFQLSNVPSPSTYDLVVVKAGYATATQRVDVSAGEIRKGVTIRLVKGDGLISGRVTDGAKGLGGVTITATSGQSTASTVSLTGTANAGKFTLRTLSTPASYTVIATRAGYASQTVALSLSSGQRLTGVDVTMSRSSAQLKGTVYIGDNPAPGVSVTITDGRTTVQSVTDSGQDVPGSRGTWAIAGLAVPGVYTATFSRPDLTSQTVPIALDAAGRVTQGSVGVRVSDDNTVRVRMVSATATVYGTVRQDGGRLGCAKPGNLLGEASVTLTSGPSSWTVTTASVAPHCGQYRVDGLPPGSYTVTATSSSGTTPTSRVVALAAGDKRSVPIKLPDPASLFGYVSSCLPRKPTCYRPGWTVFLYARGDYPEKVYDTAVTKSDGRFDFSDIDAGTYVLTAGPTPDPANATNSKVVKVQPSQRRGPIPFKVSQ